MTPSHVTFLPPVLVRSGRGGRRKGERGRESDDGEDWGDGDDPGGERRVMIMVVMVMMMMSMGIMRMRMMNENEDDVNGDDGGGE